MFLVRSLLLLTLFGVFTALAPAEELKLHPLFTDHMVLQRNTNAPIWGKAAAKSTVTVIVKKQNYTAKVVGDANEQGQWQLEVKAPAGTGYTVTITSGSETKTLRHVAFGDVWICSGQSNMEWRLRQLTQDDQGKKIAATAKNPNIRLFSVPNTTQAKPQTEFPVTPSEGRWQECTPETALNFSAAGYFFGREIEKSQKVPVGLIASEWGGTPAEAWTPRSALAAHPELKHYADALDKLIQNFDPKKAEESYQAALKRWQAAVEAARKAGKQPPRRPIKPGASGVHQHTPAALYNAMIHPLYPFAFTGVIWYQGESNASRAAEYRALFTTMIQSWRDQWNHEFPFLLVQLAPFRGGASGVDYAELRDAQYFATKKLNKVGMAVITDVGEETDIHPQRKEPVGSRLALAARALAYNEKIEFSGPEYRSSKIEGDKIIVSFHHVGQGLTCQGETLTGFQICGKDNKFYPAQAKIEGDKVIVSCAEVSEPVALRFGWFNFAKPTLNFFNKDGLPAVPFRTDTLPLTTQRKK